MKRIIKTAVVVGLCYCVIYLCWARPINTDEWQESAAALPQGQVTLTSAKRTYLPWTQTIQCVWSNYGSAQVIFGHGFELHKQVDGKWLVAQRSDGMGYGWVDIALGLEPGVWTVYPYRIHQAVERLASGQYRIAAKYSVEQPDGTWRSCQAYANFQVK